MFGVSLPSQAILAPEEFLNFIKEWNSLILPFCFFKGNFKGLILPFQSCSLSHWAARANPPHTERWNIFCQLRDTQNSHFYININQTLWKHKFSLPASTPQENFKLLRSVLVCPVENSKWLQVKVHTGHLVDLSYCIPWDNCSWAWWNFLLAFDELCSFQEGEKTAPAICFNWSRQFADLSLEPWKSSAADENPLFPQ